MMKITNLVTKSDVILQPRLLPPHKRDGRFSKLRVMLLFIFFCAIQPQAFILIEMLGCTTSCIDMR